MTHQPHIHVSKINNVIYYSYHALFHNNTSSVFMYLVLLLLLATVPLPSECMPSRAAKHGETLMFVDEWSPNEWSPNESSSDDGAYGQHLIRGREDPKADGYDMDNNNNSTIMYSEKMNVELLQCSSQESTIMRTVLRAMAANWDSYARHLKPTGMVDNCQRRRFMKNGSVRCAELHPSIAGEAAFDTTVVWLNMNYLRALNRHLDPKAVHACTAKLIAHEFSHTCGHDEPYADALDDASFKWFKRMFGTNVLHRQCGTT